MAVIETHELTKEYARARGIEEVSMATIFGLDSPRDVAEGRDRGRTAFLGDIDPVIKAAARHTVTELELSRPTPEETFLTYYEGIGSR